MRQQGRQERPAAPGRALFTYRVKVAEAVEGRETIARFKEGKQDQRQRGRLPQAIDEAGIGKRTAAEETSAGKPDNRIPKKISEILQIPLENGGKS